MFSIAAIIFIILIIGIFYYQNKTTLPEDSSKFKDNKDFSEMALYLTPVLLILDQFLEKMSSNIITIPPEKSFALYNKTILFEKRDLKKEVEFMAFTYVQITNELLFKNGVKLVKNPDIKINDSEISYQTAFEDYKNISFSIFLSRTNNASFFSIIIA